MADYRQSVAFSAFQPFLRILTVYKWENFQAPGSHRSRNVCRAAVVSLFAFSSIMLILSDAWHCYSHQFDFRESALPIAILFSAPALAIAYISIGMKGGMIIEVIDHLNEIVSKRNALIRTYHCNRRDSHSIGSNKLSHDATAYARYGDLDKRYAAYASILIKYYMWNLIPLFGVSALVPVSYLICGYPQPQHWSPLLGFR